MGEEEDDAERRVAFLTKFDDFLEALDLEGALDFLDVGFAVVFFFETTFLGGGLFLPLVVRETLFLF
ncbi:MAG: hypothetical protein NPIRA02_22330 [Nitrospirales bacterium]|nr:MAG: hypothetical protein NPIRA02_22330 [Nitrospirales bacterium]